MVPGAKAIAGSGKAITRRVGGKAMKLSAGLSAIFMVWDAYDMIDNAIGLANDSKHELSV